MFDDFVPVPFLIKEDALRSADNIEHLRIDGDSKVIYATHKTVWSSFIIGVLASAVLLNGRTIVITFIRLITWFSELILKNIGG